MKSLRKQTISKLSRAFAFEDKLCLISMQMAKDYYNFKININSIIINPSFERYSLLL